MNAQELETRGAPGANRSISIGSGGIGAGDRLEPAVELANSGAIRYLGFDALAERTLALAQVRRTADATAGHDERLPQMPALFVDYLAKGGVLIGNFGAANLDSAASIVRDGLADRGLGHIKIGVVRGDDVLAQALERDVELPERNCSIRDVADRVVSAHAYIGAEGVLGLLGAGATFVIGGRIADPSVWVGAICHELGWALDDYDRVARATLVGHLLEGGIGRAAGDVPLPTGYPMATVTDDSIEISKLPGTGGPIDVLAGKKGLAHEIHDPCRYLTPDVTADLSGVSFEQLGPDRIRVHGGRGSAPPDSYRILVGLDLGWKVVGEVSFGGPRCVERARAQGAKIIELLDRTGHNIEDRRVDIHGVDAVFADAYTGGYPADCRLRVAVRVADRDAADDISVLFWQLYGNGGGGVTRSMDRAIGVTPAFLDRSCVDVSWELVN